MDSPSVVVVYIVEPSIRVRELILSLAPSVCRSTRATKCFVILVVPSVHTPRVMNRALMTAWASITDLYTLPSIMNQ